MALTEKKRGTRQNTSLESEGAEFLVLGNLLIEGIVAHKTYTNNPGYDLVAIDPEHGTSARIQVKSRWKTGAEGFIIRNFSADFVVVVLLNRGTKDGRGKVAPPEFYVLPSAAVKAASDKHENAWGKLSLGHIAEFTESRDKWGVIRDFLRRTPPGPAPGLEPES